MAQPLPAPSAQLPPEENEEEEEEDEKKTYERCKALASTFPMAGSSGTMRKHKEGSWYAPTWDIVGTMVAEKHFKARSTDIIIASFPKSGTTWTKALLYATVNRRVDLRGPNNPLFSYNPHQCVPVIESQVYTADGALDIGSLPDPRLFSTHIPYRSLPKTVFESGCRIVYVWRDAKAVWNSMVHYARKIFDDESVDFSSERSFEGFSKIFGGCWDHVLEYRKNSKESNMLFLKYEDMLKDTKNHVKKLGEFVGLPFTAEEEMHGVPDKIVELCSLKNLKDLSVNQTGVTRFADLKVDNKAFFRKGETDDWMKHLTSEMVEKIDGITRDKFADSDLALWI